MASLFEKQEDTSTALTDFTTLPTLPTPPTPTTKQGVYRGYVDDERNTDNAWVETTVVLIRIKRRLSLRMKAELDRKRVSGEAEWSEFEWVDFCRCSTVRSIPVVDRVSECSLPCHSPPLTAGCVHTPRPVPRAALA
jgi:hypothetical protein